MITLLHLMTQAHAGIGLVLGYRPFLDPLPLHDYWLILLLPLVFAVALVYKAIKLDDLNHLWKQSLNLAGQIIVFMILAAAGLWLLNVLV